MLMLTELRTKSQITLPKKIVNNLGLSIGDQLEIYEKNGIIYLVPVACYPKKYIDELEEEIENIKGNIKKGEQPIFDNIDDLISKLDK